MKVLYIDESGTNNLSVIDPGYPVFILGGIIVDDGQPLGDMDWRVRALKRRVFKSETPVLHSTDVYHNKPPWFTSMQVPANRARFNQEFSTLLETLDYQVLACVIDKNKHLKRYGPTARNPYYYALSVLVERFYLELQSLGDEKGRIVAEERDPLNDGYLHQEWNRLRTQGTGPLNPASLQERIVGLETRSKAENIAGLQVADMILAVIGRHSLNLDSSDRVSYSVVEGKYRRGPKGRYEGFGLVTLPRTTRRAAQAATQNP